MFGVGIRLKLFTAGTWLLCFANDSIVLVGVALAVLDIVELVSLAFSRFDLIHCYFDVICDFASGFGTFVFSYSLMCFGHFWWSLLYL